MYNFGFNTFFKYKHKSMRTLQILIILSVITKLNSVAVISVDLGCEYIKMGVVKPGTPMGIVLTPDTSRKFYNALAIKGEELLVGDTAITHTKKNPQEAYMYIPELLAKNMYCTEVEDFHKDFPYYSLGSRHHEKAYHFRLYNSTYTPEEIIAFILDRSREIAERFCENQPIVGYILVVPPYYNEAERLALLKAAQIADMKILQIMNSNAAVALRFGLFRQKDFNESHPQNFIFYDIGGCGTHASVISFQMVQANSSSSSTGLQPQLTVKGLGFDRSIGGRNFQLRLRDHLATKFNEQTISSTQTDKNKLIDITQNAKAMMKLYVEAGKVMKILSANTYTRAKVEHVVDELNLDIEVTRKDFETLCQDLFDRATEPIETAVKSAEISLDDISQILLFGAPTRIPILQEKLAKYTKKNDLGKLLNTDEDAALGAAYQAAYVSQSFVAKRFIVKDAFPYPIKIEYYKEPPVLENTFESEIKNEKVSHEDNDGNEREIVKRVLIPRMSFCGQKRVVTFNRNMHDFSFNISYDEMPFLSEPELKNFASFNISQIHVKGVTDIVQQYSSDPYILFKGIKVHFVFDESCLLRVDRVDAHFYRNKSSEESTLSKIGSSIKKFFTGLKGEGDGQIESETNSRDDTLKNEDYLNDRTKLDGEDMTFNNSNNDKTANSGQDRGDTNKTNNNEINVNQNDTNMANISNYALVETLKFEVENLDFPQLNDQEIADAQSKLAEFKRKESDRNDLAERRNSLEAAIFNTRDKFEHDEIFRNFSSTQERDAILSKLTKLSAWYDDHGFKAGKEELGQMLSDLKLSLKPIDDRIVMFDKAFKGLDKMFRVLNETKEFLVTVKNMTWLTEKPIFSPVEIEKIETLYNATQLWFNQTVDTFKSISYHQNPPILAKVIKEKRDELSKELTYLRNKGRAEAMNQAKILTENLKLKDKVKEYMDKSKKAAQKEEQGEQSEKAESKTQDSESSEENEIPILPSEDSEKLKTPNQQKKSKHPPEEL